jgi:hypothetical protein
MASIILETISYSKALVTFSHNPEKDLICDEEYRRRVYLLLFACLRGPFYESFFKYISYITILCMLYTFDFIIENGLIMRGNKRRTDQFFPLSLVRISFFSTILFS